jgi:hypothetical protein
MKFPVNESLPKDGVSGNRRCEVAGDSTLEERRFKALPFSMSDCAIYHVERFTEIERCRPCCLP